MQPVRPVLCMLSHVQLCSPMDCSPPGFSVYGISQARILEWVAISYSRGIFSTQGLNPHLLHCRHLLYHWSTPPANAGGMGSIPGSGRIRKIPWRRKWQLTSVFVPGKSHGQRSINLITPFLKASTIITSRECMQVWAYEFESLHCEETTELLKH